MLVEEAEVRAKLLPVHLRPTRRRRGSADVHELRSGPEDDAPTGGAHPVAEVDLLVEHEEALVEAADLVERLTAHEQHCPDEELGVAARADGRSPRRRTRSAGGCAARANAGTGTRSRDATASGSREPRAGASRRGSRAAARRRRPRLALGEGDEPLHGTFAAATRRRSSGAGTCRRRARSLVQRAAVARDCSSSATRRACGKRSRTSSCEPSVEQRVDDDHLVRLAELAQATLEIGARIVRCDDDRDVRRHEPQYEAGSARLHIAERRAARPRLHAVPAAARREARRQGDGTASSASRGAERDRAALSAAGAGRPSVDRGDRRPLRARARGARAGPRARLSRRLAWAVGLVHGLPPWAADCRSAAYDSALERLLDEWRPDVVEIHLQAMAQYVGGPGPHGSPAHPRRLRPRLGLGRRARGTGRAACGASRAGSRSARGGVTSAGRGRDSTRSSSSRSATWPPCGRARATRR